MSLDELQKLQEDADRQVMEEVGITATQLAAFRRAEARHKIRLAMMRCNGERLRYTNVLSPMEIKLLKLQEDSVLTPGSVSRELLVMAREMFEGGLLGGLGLDDPAERTGSQSGSERTAPPPPPAPSPAEESNQEAPHRPAGPAPAGPAAETSRREASQTSGGGDAPDPTTRGEPRKAPTGTGTSDAPESPPTSGRCHRSSLTLSLPFGIRIVLEKTTRRGVDQPADHPAHNREVAGSNPAPATSPHHPPQDAAGTRTPTPRKDARHAHHLRPEAPPPQQDRLGSGHHARRPRVVAAWLHPRRRRSGEAGGVHHHHHHRRERPLGIRAGGLWAAASPSVRSLGPTTPPRPRPAGACRMGARA